MKFHMIRQDRPNFSDSGFSDGFSGVFTTAMSELEWFVQPPQPSSTIPPVDQNHRDKRVNAKIYCSMCES